MGAKAAPTRRRIGYIAAGGLVLAAIIAAVALSDTAPPHHRSVHRTTVARRVAPPAPARPTPAPAGPPYKVGVRTLRLVDHSRSIQLPGGGSEPRTLVTYVRYPTLGSRHGDLPGAPPAASGGPYPLVIFGHGFAVSPTIYDRLMRAWTRAGYIVAAPVFPLENPDAPGGADESDLVNQPGDVRFLITSLLRGPFARLIDHRRIAVTGQSDGGETALAVAYDTYYRDPRVGAAIILSGAKIPGVGGFTFPQGSPPLLATQGTADTINPPSFTDAFYGIAPRPKFRLTLFGADHLGPYTDGEPQLQIVERVTVAFLDRYLRHDLRAMPRLVDAGRVPGLATIDAEP